MTSEEKQEKKRDPNNPCLFCRDAREVSLKNELAYSARDSYAVGPGHTLVATRRHVENPQGDVRHVISKKGHYTR